jgi:hypothetical protein
MPFLSPRVVFQPSSSIGFVAQPQGASKVRIVSRLGFLVGGLAAGVFLQPAFAEGPDAVESLQKAASDWVKVRAETAQIESDWNSQKPFLTSMVDSLNERADAAEAKREYLLAKTSKDRGELAGLEASSTASSDGLQATDTQLKAMDARLLVLRASLPTRLSAALELPYKGLASAELPVGDRMQLTMAVLNRCIQFDRVITCEDELLNVEAAGNPRLMEVIYWGLSHGYALDRRAGAAWYGSPGAHGWQWEPLPGGFAQVAQVVAVYHGKSEPVFVEVPARLKTPAPDSKGEARP